MMAHVEKFSRGAIGGLSIHIERKTENHSNKDIDNSKTKDNYDLCEKDGDMMSRYKERLNEVHCLNRADVKVMADWVVTLPEELKEKPRGDKRAFFEETYDFLSERYGKENVLAGVVHNDETTPHMHFAFMPVTYDEKREREKVSAKEVLNRNELKSFHQDLDKHLKEKIPHVYEKGVLNDKTIGVKDIATLKEKSKEIKQLTENINMKKQSLNKEIKKVNDLRVKARSVNNTKDKMTQFENKLGKTVFGKRVMTSKDYNELQTFVVGVQKSGLENVKTINQLERENVNLFNKLEKTTRELEEVSEHKNDLLDTNRHLEVKLERLEDGYNSLEDDLTVANSKLKDLGHDRSKMSEIEYKGHLVIDRLESGYKPKNKKVADNWKGILDKNKEKKLINNERLNKAMEKLKEIVQKIIAKAKDFSL